MANQDLSGDHVMEWFREYVKMARAHEREECARIAEEALIDCPDDPQFQDGINGHARDIADAIRRRGK